MNIQEFENRLEKLIEVGQELIEVCPSVSDMEIIDKNIDMRINYRKWRISTLNLLRSYFGESHYFYKILHGTKSTWQRILDKGEKHNFDYTKESIADQVGILMSIKEEIKAGLVSDAQHLFEANLFSNILDQAKGFCEKNYFLGAAIHGRLIIENYINDLIRLKKIKIEEKDKFPQKLIKLRENGIIDLPTERLIQSQYDIGSYAAHGDNRFSNYNNKEKILGFLDIIQTKILTIVQIDR